MRKNSLRFLVFCAAAALAGSEMGSFAAAATGGGAAGGGTAGATAPSAGPFSPARPGVPANPNNSIAPSAPAGTAQQQLNPNQQQGVAVVTSNGVVVATNVFVTTNTFGTNLFGFTNGFGLSTNGFVLTNQFAVSNFIAFTNLFLTTNAVSFTNHFGLGRGDTAITEFDRTIIIRVRQRLFPLMQTEGGWAPISFLSDRGAVIVFGEVISLRERDQVIAAAQATPGVVRIANGLFINPQLFRTPATSATGSISRFLQPASDPALGDYYLHSSTSNSLGQRTYEAPERGTFVATNQNLPGVSNLSGVTFTNLSPTGPTNLPIPLSELLTNTNSVTSPR